MLLENTGLNGVRSDLGHLDDSSEKLGFVRWQWEYRRATYDLKLQSKGDDYYVRIATRAIEGKLENPDAVLEIEHVYIGRATFPHGLEYESPVPEPVLSVATQRLQDLKKLLAK